MGNARHNVVTHRAQAERETPYIERWRQHVPSDVASARSGAELLTAARAGQIDPESLSAVERYRLERERWRTSRG